MARFENPENHVTIKSLGVDCKRLFWVWSDLLGFNRTKHLCGVSLIVMTPQISVAFGMTPQIIYVVSH